MLGLVVILPIDTQLVSIVEEDTHFFELSIQKKKILSSRFSQPITFSKDCKNSFFWCFDSEFK